MLGRTIGDFTGKLARLNGMAAAYEGAVAAAGSARYSCGSGSSRSATAASVTALRRARDSHRSRWLAAFAIGLLLATPSEGEAQRAAPPMARLCYISASPPNVFAEAFLQGMKDLGYTPGRDLLVEHFSSDGHVERFPALVARCLKTTPDVIVSVTTPAALAAKRATSTIPIVAPGTGDPVATGIVASLARPGGNITGSSLMAPGLGRKRLELLKTVVPDLSTVAVLSNTADPIATVQLRDLEDGARALRLQLRVYAVQTREALTEAVATAARDGAQGVLTTQEAIFFLERLRLVELVARHRLPAVYPFRAIAEAGGLMAYGPDLPVLFRRAATFVDRILKGARPADLPVGQPTDFDLVVNRKTAAALGLTLPPTLLLQAHRVLD